MLGEQLCENGCPRPRLFLCSEVPVRHPDESNSDTLRGLTALGEHNWFNSSSDSDPFPIQQKN